LQRSADSHNTYILEVNADESIAPHTFEYSGAINITIVLRGVGGNRTIRLKSHECMFRVNSNVTLILENNITIHGHSGNNKAMVDVYGGTFKMNGSIITGNDRAGVFISDNGTFIMNGGAISNNTDEHGGGVNLVRGTFTMNGGTIFGNTAEYGGGVYVNLPGTFTMSGGIISGNNAKKSGGGVAVYRETFNMSGGTISGNTAGVSGGGVFLQSHMMFNNTYYVKFNKTGGTITGYNSDSNNGNVVNDGSGVIARKGHAVYISDTRRKEITAGQAVKLSYDNGNYSGAWDE